MQLHLRKKISLLSLMEITFRSQSGVLTFGEIAAAAALPPLEVELLVMKALSLNLVKGTIDEVDQQVHLTWVQPRVLDREQIGMLRTKIDSWCKDVQKIEHLIETKAQDFACLNISGTGTSTVMHLCFFLETNGLTRVVIFYPHILDHPN